MTSLIRNFAIAAVCGVGLAACGSGGSNSPPPPPPVVVPPPPPPTKLEDSFGAGFGIAFRADMNTEASDPVPGDLIPLSLTTEPTTI